MSPGRDGGLGTGHGRTPGTYTVGEPGRPRGTGRRRYTSGRGEDRRGGVGETNLVVDVKTKEGSEVDGGTGSGGGPRGVRSVSKELLKGRRGDFPP